MFRNCGCSSMHNQCPCENDYNDDNDCNNDYDNDCGMYEDSCNIENSCSYYPNEYPCSCGYNQGNSLFPNNIMYGHSYVPNQIMNKVYTPEIGLKMGTIFPELVSPYAPCQSMETINYLKKSNEIKEGCNSYESNML